MGKDRKDREDRKGTLYVRLMTQFILVLGAVPREKIAVLLAETARADARWRARLKVGGDRRGLGGMWGSNGDLVRVQLVIGSTDWRHQRDAKFYYSRQ